MLVIVLVMVFTLDLLAFDDEAMKLAKRVNGRNSGGWCLYLFSKLIGIPEHLGKAIHGYVMTLGMMRGQLTNPCRHLVLFEQDASLFPDSLVGHTLGVIGATIRFGTSASFDIGLAECLLFRR